MAARNSLPFEYQMRGQQMQYLDGDVLAHAIDQRDRDLEDYLGTATAGAWKSLPLINGWVAYGSGFQAPRMRKVGDIVYIEGLVNGVAATSIALALLPAGMVPVTGATIFSQHGVSGAVRVDVYTSGQINATVSLPYDYLSLAGIHFSVRGTT